MWGHSVINVLPSYGLLKQRRHTSAILEVTNAALCRPEDAKGKTILVVLLQMFARRFNKGMTRQGSMLYVKQQRAY
jgi:hypothetical protein